MTLNMTVIVTVLRTSLRNTELWPCAPVWKVEIVYWMGGFAVHSVAHRAIRSRVHIYVQERKAALAFGLHGALCLSKSWKPLICSFKKPSEYDTRSTRLRRSYTIGSSCSDADLMLIK
jgi:hypothetical protein